MLTPLLLATLLQEDWWDARWQYRRRITIQNRSDEPIPKGHQLCVELDPKYLGIDARSAAGYPDLVLVHGGREQACRLLPGRNGRLALWFRAVEEIPKESRDVRYGVYYGNPSGRRTADSPVFDFAEDFSSGRSDLFEADADVQLAIRDGRLTITDASAERTDLAPSLVRLRVAAIPPNFALSLDLEIEPQPDAVFDVGLRVDFKETIEVTEALRRKIDRLADRLGAFDWEDRESATTELLKIGTPAIPRLEQSLRSSDPEVKWRAAHILKELRETATWPVILAGLRIGDPEIKPAALLWRVGKTFQRQRYEGPLRMSLSIERDPDGEVTLRWDGRRPSGGEIKGEVKSLSIFLCKGTSGRPGVIRVDNVLLRRCLAEDSRPAFTLETEERKP